MLKDVPRLSELDYVPSGTYYEASEQEVLWPLIDFCVLFFQMLVFPFESNMPWNKVVAPLQITLPIIQLQFNFPEDW